MTSDEKKGYETYACVRKDWRKPVEILARRGKNTQLLTDGICDGILLMTYVRKDSICQDHSGAEE